MSFVVSARKYRPRNFDELVGQDHIGQTLRNALKNDQLAHAFLFAGPRGVGKTTSARILARILNCENLQDGYKACGECASCKAFADNASFNIFELDAASNNSVEHIRALNEQVRFQPQQGSYKIYIIDEVHMLSSQAFNAFLKTLEEPPPYAKFILATTEKHKIIPTILSRCQIFDFRRISVADIVTQLKDIAEKEGRKIDDDALHLIAQKADGAMRDALSIFDKVVSSVDGEIGHKEVAENLNVLDYDYYFRITDAALQEDFRSVITIYDEIIKNGFEAQQFVPGLMAHLRDLLMIRDMQTASLLEVGEKLRQRYAAQASMTREAFLLTALSILNDTDIHLVRSQNKRLSVELALSKICYMNKRADKKKTVDPSEKPGHSQKLKTNGTTTPEPGTGQAKAEHKTTPEAIEPAGDATDKKPEDKKPDQNEQASPSEMKKPESEKNTKNQDLGSRKSAPKSSSVSAPRISTNLDSLIASIEQEENHKNENGHPFTSEAVAKIFSDFKDKSNSQSLKTALGYTKIVIKGDDIEVITPARIYVDFIKQEMQLLEKIHEQYPKRDMKIRFKVSEEDFPEYEAPKKPKMLTTKEKYDLLVNKNPDFKKMVDAFKLKIASK